MLYSVCSILNPPPSTVCVAHLHADDGVDEEQHGDEQADVRQSFEGLNEGPQKDPDGVTLTQEFDQTSRSKQLQEAHVERVHELQEDTQGNWG